MQWLCDPIPCCQGRVTIHVGPVRSADHIDPGHILDGVELQRYHRFARPDDAARFMVGRLMLKTIVGGLSGCRPDRVHVSLGDRERPYVAGAPDFNLSHSGDMVVLAVASEGRVGVDIEAVEREADVRKLAGRVYSQSEFAAFCNLDNTCPAVKIWCAKEALVKAIGEGLYIDPRSISLDIENPAFSTLNDNILKNCDFYVGNLLDKYVIASVLINETICTK
jgi:4'-phosphopantetheinyl transferase